MLMKSENPYLTVLEFRSKDASVTIDEAMLALFPLAEWNEVSDRSTFESKSLCNLLLVTHLENSKAVFRKIVHKFNLLDKHCVQLMIMSKAKPILRKRTLHKLLPNLKFVLHSVEQDLYM